MKKGMKLFLALFVTIVMLSGCRGSGQDGKITLRVAHVEAEDRSTHKALLKFKEKVEKDSNGKIEVDIFANGLLGGDRALIEGVELGTIHMALPTTSVLTAYDEKFGILDMPFLFNSSQSAFNALDGELGDKLNSLISEKGFQNLGYLYNGGRSITNSKRAVNEPADLKGLKIRVMEAPIFIQMFNELGANATPMSFGEVFTALQQKTIDGQENAPSLVYAMRYDEVQPHYSLTNHVHNFLPILINQGFYDKLSEQDRKVILDASGELITLQRKLELDDTDTYVEKLREKGMKVNEITPENQKKFVDAVQAVYKNNEGVIGKELFEIAKKYN